MAAPSAHEGNAQAAVAEFKAQISLIGQAAQSLVNNATAETPE